MATATNERSIRLYRHEVRAALDRGSVQIRRVAGSDPQWSFRPREDSNPHRIETWDKVCFYGGPGDRLWVKETWATSKGAGIRQVAYSADGQWGSPMASGGVLMHGWVNPIASNDKSGQWVGRDYFNAWRSSVHMPRCASRFDLEVRGVRVERLQNITEEDAKASGVDRPLPRRRLGYAAVYDDDWTGAFRLLWESINAKSGHGWDANDWVWVVDAVRLASATCNGE